MLASFGGGGGPGQRQALLMSKLGRALMGGGGITPDDKGREFACCCCGWSDVCRRLAGRSPSAVASGLVVGENASPARRLPVFFRDDETDGSTSSVRCEAGVEMAGLTLSVVPPPSEADPSNDARGVS